MRFGQVQSLDNGKGCLNHSRSVDLSGGGGGGGIIGSPTVALLAGQ